MDNKNIVHIPKHPSRVYGKEWKGWDDLFGCPLNWSQLEALSFLNLIQDELNLLQPLEIIAIIEQSSSKTFLQSHNSFKKILQAEGGSQERKIAVQELVSKLKIEAKGEDTVNNNIAEIEKQPSELEDILHIVSQESIATENQTTEMLQEKCIYTLKAYDGKHGISGLDQETITYLIFYRINMLWHDVMSINNDVKFLEEETGGKYFTWIKKLFLEEYNSVTNLAIPTDYQFKDNNGKYAEPNLMQKLVAFRLAEKKRYGNWSYMGSGKTLSAILAGRIIGLKNTLIVTFNANVEDWNDTALNAFPNSTNVLNKEKKHIPKFSKQNFNYLVYNYETFQQEKNVDAIISAITINDIDYIVLDEVQMIKQREEENSSFRRGIIKKLIKVIEANNRKRSKDTYILAMSATPVINNLIEPKKILEILLGVEYHEVKTSPAINNALNIHRHLFINGIRFKPQAAVAVKHKIIKIDGRHLIDRFNNIPRSEILNTEQLFIPDKLLNVKNYIEKGTIIYTHYVTGIIDEVKSFVNACGFSVGIYTGLEKSGLQNFKKGSCDILLCSAPVGTGVDGLQRISKRLIILNLPWTNSEYENLIGRIARQGSAFNSVEVIIPQVEMNIKGQLSSWDVVRMARIENKRTLSDIALDGIIPSDMVPTPNEMLRQAKSKLKKWIERIGEIGLIKLDRETMYIQETEGVIEIKQNQTQLSFKNVKIIGDVQPKKIGVFHKNEIIENVIAKKNDSSIVEKKRPGAKLNLEKISGETKKNITLDIDTLDDRDKPLTVCITLKFWAQVKTEHLILNPIQNQAFKKQLDKLYETDILPQIENNRFFPKPKENIYVVNFPDAPLDNVYSNKCYFVIIELYLHTINCISAEKYPLDKKGQSELSKATIKVGNMISDLNLFAKNDILNITKKNFKES